jgi:hypothetical protein
MKMEIWPDDVSMPEMSDWLAELRDDGGAEQAEDGPDGRASVGEASPEVLVPAQPDRPVSPDQASNPAKSSPVGLGWPAAEADSPRPAWPAAEAESSSARLAWPPAESSSPRPAWPPAEADSPGPAWPAAEADSPGPAWPAAEADSPGSAWPAAEADSPRPAWPPTDASPTGRIRVPAEASPTGQTPPPAEASSRSRTRPARTSAPAEITERAVIGDQLRMPIVWCEMGSCISWHADRAALGEADIRARAIGAGWRVDALGRLACPRCQQTAPGFRVSRPVVLWDRHAAITRAARMAGMRGSGAAGERGRDPRPPATHRLPVSQRLPASPPEPERRREHTAAKTTVGRHAR